MHVRTESGLYDLAGCHVYVWHTAADREKFPRWVLMVETMGGERARELLRSHDHVNERAHEFVEKCLKRICAALDTGQRIVDLRALQKQNLDAYQAEINTCDVEGCDAQMVLSTPDGRWCDEHRPKVRNHD